MTANTLTHLYRGLRILGVVALFVAVNTLAIYWLGEGLWSEAIGVIPGVLVILFTATALKGERNGTLPAVVATLFLIAPFLVMLVVWLGLPLQEIPALIPFLSALGFCLLTGFGEELIFRGYLQRVCEGWSTVIAVIVPSLIFGLLHYSYGVNAIWISFVVGLSFALARLAGASLILLSVVHGLVNLPNHLPHTITSYYSLLVILALAYTAVLTILHVFRHRHWANSESTDPIKEHIR